MDISVCIKIVNSNLVYNDNMHGQYVINPYDLLALQHAVKIKDMCDCTVNCFSMGHEAIRESLIRSVAMGADEVYWLKDKDFAGADTVATSYVLSKGLEKADKKDLIICGSEAVDGETGQVPFGIARRLGYVCISGAEEIIQCDEEYVVVKAVSGQYENILKVKLPALLVFRGYTTVCDNLSLIKLKRAKNKKFIELDAEDIEANREHCGVRGSRTRVLNTVKTLKRKNKMDLEGTSEEIGLQLHRILRSD